MFEAILFLASVTLNVPVSLREPDLAADWFVMGGITLAETDLWMVFVALELFFLCPRA